MEIEFKKIEINRLNMQLADDLTRQSLRLATARENLNNVLAMMPLAELRAPFDGVITYLFDFTRGQFVPGYRNVVYITDESDLFVEYLNNRERLAVSLDKTVSGLLNGETIGLERRPLSRQENSIIMAAMGPQNNWTGPVRFNVAGNTRPYRVGDYVYIYALTNQRENVLRIPVNALYSDLEQGDYVYMDVGGRKVLQIVQIGVRTTAFVEILDGLQEGDVVYVRA
jgi:HlyD family secretion protein